MAIVGPPRYRGATMAVSRASSRLDSIPLIGGVLGGWYGLWRWGGALALNQRVDGYAWADYLGNAWALHSGQTGRLDAFRLPLHGALVALAGDPLGSYVNGALLVSGLCAGLMVFAAAMAAHRLAGPWAGAAAALALPFGVHAADAARHANNYPLLGAVTGLSLAMALAYLHRPGWLLAIGAGLCGAAALATDVRGAAALPAIGLAMGWALLSLRRGRVLAHLLLTLTLCGMGTQVSGWLGQRNQMDVARQRAIQQEVVERFDGFTHDAELIQRCRGESGAIGIAGLISPCGQARARWNLTQGAERHLNWGLPATLLGLALLLLPGRRAPGALRGGLVVLIGGAGPLLALMAATPMADRYWTQFVVLLSVAAPAGFGRLLGWGPRVLAPIGLGIAVYAAWTEDPTHRVDRTGQQMNPVEVRAPDIHAAVEAQMGPDDPYFDCSRYHVSHGLLPRHAPWSGLPTPNLPEGHRCREWLAAPPEGRTAWFGFSPTLEMQMDRRSPTRTPLTGVENYGWEQVWTSTDFELWRHSPEPSP